MRMEISEALITIVICGVLGAVVWERMGGNSVVVGCSCGFGRCNCRIFDGC